MKNFSLILKELDVAPALAEVLRQPDEWNKQTGRKTPDLSPHKEVDDIWLRQTAGVADHRECVPSEAIEKFPICRRMIYDTAAYFQADRVGRAYLSRMKPGAKIGRHRDVGPDLKLYYDTEHYWSRVHIVLQGNSHFYAGDEVVEMFAGEMWWFDGTQEHWVENTGVVDRIHLFMDLRVI